MSERSHGDAGCILVLNRISFDLKLPLEVKLIKDVCFKNQLSTIYATLSCAKHEAHLVLIQKLTYSVIYYFFRGFAAVSTVVEDFTMITMAHKGTCLARPRRNLHRRKLN